MELEALQEAIQRMGTQRKLAAALGKSQAHVAQWVKRGRVPADMVLPIESALAVPGFRHKLRPDVFGPAPE